MNKGLIWQDEENIIDVVYKDIYGLPVKEALHIVELYQSKELISLDWIFTWLNKIPNRHYGDVDLMLEDWMKEKE